MKDWARAQESMKADINQLKDQMSQILEALADLRNTKDRNEEATSANPAVPQPRVLPI